MGGVMSGESPGSCLIAYRLIYKLSISTCLPNCCGQFKLSYVPVTHVAVEIWLVEGKVGRLVLSRLKI